MASEKRPSVPAGAPTSPPTVMTHSSAHARGLGGTQRETAGRTCESGWLHSVSRRARQPTPAFLPAKSHGQGSLVGRSPWGHRVNTTEVTSHTYVVEFSRLCCTPLYDHITSTEDESAWFPGFIIVRSAAETRGPMLHGGDVCAFPVSVDTAENTGSLECVGSCGRHCPRLSKIVS